MRQRGEVTAWGKVIDQAAKVLDAQQHGAPANWYERARDVRQNLAHVLGISRPTVYRQTVREDPDRLLLFALLGATLTEGNPKRAIDELERIFREMDANGTCRLSADVVS